MLEQRPGIRTERLKLSPDGKPIVRVLDFTMVSILKCDLFPFAQSTVNRPVDQNGIKEEFAELIISRSTANEKWLKENSTPINQEILEAIQNVTSKSQGVDLNDPEKLTELTNLFEFVTQVGDPREIDRPFSSSLTLSKDGLKKVINKDVVLKYMASDDDIWGAFWITSDKGLRVLRDSQIERGLKPNPHLPGTIAVIDYHLSRTRPRLFLGSTYELIIWKSFEDSFELKVNSTIPAKIKDVPFYFGNSIEFLQDLQSGKVVLR